MVIEAPRADDSVEAPSPVKTESSGANILKDQQTELKSEIPTVKTGRPSTGFFGKCINFFTRCFK